MKRILLLLLLPCAALAEYHPPIEYGKATTIHFVLYNSDGSLDTDEVDGGAEVTLMCNEGSPATATNDFADEGSSYSLALTASETACARIEVAVGATDLNIILIPTFGHPLAQIISYEPFVAAGLVDEAGSTTTIPLADGDVEANDFYNGYVVKLVGGTCAGQEATITDYVGTVDTGNVATITTVVTAPSTDCYYIIMAEKRAVITVDASGYVAADVKLIEAGDATDALDTAVAPVKTKTDQLTFTVTNEVDANTKSMNDSEVCGDGATVSTKWTGNCP